LAAPRVAPPPLTTGNESLAAPVSKKIEEALANMDSACDSPLAIMDIACDSPFDIKLDSVESMVLSMLESAGFNDFGTALDEACKQVGQPQRDPFEDLYDPKSASSALEDGTEGDKGKGMSPKDAAVRYVRELFEDEWLRWWEASRRTLQNFSTVMLPAEAWHRAVTRIGGEVCGRDGQDRTEVVDIRKINPDYRTIIMAQISILSHSVFTEDLLSEAKQRDGWRVVVCHLGAQLHGYLVYRKWGPPVRMMVVLRVAVLPQMRMGGSGRRLVEWIFHYARQFHDVNKVGLSARLEAVGFYERLGFTQGDFQEPPELSGADQECTQVWMERRVDRRSSSRGKRSQSRSRSEGH